MQARYGQSDSDNEADEQGSAVEVDMAEGDISTDMDFGVDGAGDAIPPSTTVTVRRPDTDAQGAGSSDGPAAAAAAASPPPATAAAASDTAESEPVHPAAASPAALHPHPARMPTVQEGTPASPLPHSQTQHVQHEPPSGQQIPQPPGFRSRSLPVGDSPPGGLPQPVASVTPQRLLTDMCSFISRAEPSQLLMSPQDVNEYRQDSSLQGLELARMSTLLAEQAQQVDVLEQRLLSAAAARDRAEVAMAEQAAMFQATESRLRTAHESELQQLRDEMAAQALAHARELSVARSRIERLEQQLRLVAPPEHKGTGKPSMGRSIDTSSPAPAAAGASGPEGELPMLKQELSDALRRESEQERLLAAYQQENEAATRRIKELEVSLKEAVTTRAPVVALTHDPPATRASTKEAAARLSEVLALQAQLEAVREQASVREAELKAQLDKLRADKKEVEARKAGVDLAAHQEGDLLVKAVRSEMEAMRSQYAAVVSELQGKLKWYAENQELLSASDKLVREQQATITALEQRLAALEGPEGKSASKRVSELQAQVVSLQQALKARGLPKTLAAVIEAAKPNAADSSLVASLQRQVDQLTDQLEAKDKEYEVALRSYQQQYQALRAQFEERQAALQAQLKGRKKETQLATQLEEQRTTYTRQIKELKTKLQQVQAQAAMGATAGASGPLRSSHAAGEPGASLAAALKARDADVARLKEELQRKTKQVAELHLKLGEAEAKVVRLGHAAAGSSSVMHSLPGTPLMASPIHASLQQQQGGEAPRSAAGRRLWQLDAATAAGQDDMQGGMVQGVGGTLVVQQLQQQNAALTAQLASLHQQLAVAQHHLLSSSLAGAPAAAAAAAKASAGELEGLRVRAEAAEMALTTVQRAHTQAVEKAALLTAEHQRALLRLQEEVAHMEATRWRERLAAVEGEAQAARGRAAAAEAELAALRQRQSVAWSPQAADFAALEHRLESMASEAAAREAKWREVLQDTQQLYAVQAELAAKKWEAGMAAKNTELQGLKARVDELLTSAARLQQQQHHRG